MVRALSVVNILLHADPSVFPFIEGDLSLYPASFLDLPPWPTGHVSFVSCIMFLSFDTGLTLFVSGLRTEVYMPTMPQG